VDPLTTRAQHAAATPQGIRSTTPAAKPDPSTLGQLFLSQLQSAGSSVGSTADPAEGEAEGAGAPLGLDAGLMSLTTLLPALQSLVGRGGAGSLVQALVGSLGGQGGGLAALLGGNASAPVAAPAAGAALLGAGAGTSSGSAADNARIVAAEARKRGVDPVAAVAMMLAESGGNNTAVGDGGTSFGLFQLHEGGMLTAAGLTKQQAFNPQTNASVALSSLASEWAKGPNRSPGEIAAASQRPADPVGYAAKVNGLMPEARRLLGM
jgi:hypothetical protein